jgi:hypothetical protein
MQVRRMYRIREVDGNDDDISDMLGELHQLIFLDAAPVPKFDRGHWWLAFCGSEPVAFAGIIPSTLIFNAGLFLPRWRAGQALWTSASVAPDASYGGPRAPEWVVFDHLRHYG